MRKPPKELEAFLQAFPPRIGRLFLATRRAVLIEAPEANELVYDAYNAVSAACAFTSRLKEAFCHVAAYSSHVNLGFNKGAELRDPFGVLQGSGARIRHIRIDDPADLRATPLAALLRAAAIQGRTLTAGQRPGEPSFTIRPTTGRKRRPKRPE